MAQEKKNNFSHIAVDADTADEIVIQAGAVDLRNAGEDQDAGTVGFTESASSVEQGVADDLFQYADEDELREYEKHLKAKRAREANRMVTTEDDLRGGHAPYKGMHIVVTLAAIALIIAFVIYYLVTK